MLKTPLNELQNRLSTLKNALNTGDNGWTYVAITGKMNLFYFTGTLADGVLIVPREGEAIFWVRRSYERTLIESEFQNIIKMNSFRDLAEYYGTVSGAVYLEAAEVNLDWWNMFTKYMPFQSYKKIDLILKKVRSVKSEYELSFIRQSGELHHKMLLEIIPELLVEGMSEAELGAKLFEKLISYGYHGVSRFSMGYSEVILGHICFNENSLFPTAFDGASGTVGLSPAVPALGNRENKLKYGDYVYIDVAVGCEGYHTDKTRIYKFGGDIDADVLRIQDKCIELRDRIAGDLSDGAIPEEIYKKNWSFLDEDFLVNFMGYGNHQVKFLGHGIGLFVDEYPVIAEKFKDPLQNNMVLAIEPKKSMKGVGMIGVEDTYLVTKSGGDILTGNDNAKIIEL